MSTVFPKGTEGSVELRLTTCGCFRHTKQEQCPWLCSMVHRVTEAPCDVLLCFISDTKLLICSWPSCLADNTPTQKIIASHSRFPFSSVCVEYSAVGALVLCERITSKAFLSWCLHCRGLGKLWHCARFKKHTCQNCMTGVLCLHRLPLLFWQKCSWVIDTRWSVAQQGWMIGGRKSAA